MKSKIINWLAGTEEGTLSVCITDSTGRNIALSLRAAEHIATDGEKGKVLYINTVQTSRQLGSSIRRHANPDYTADTEDSTVIYETVPSGLLMDEEDELSAHLKSGEIQYVIINCWEMASKNYRRKSDLIFMLNRWMEDYGTTIIVFAEKMRSNPEAQKMHLGMGIGKLSLIANEIRIFKKKEKDKEIARIQPKPTQAVIERYEEFLRTPIPVWMPQTANEELAGFQEFDLRHIPTTPHFGESPEAFRKRRLKNIGEDMQHRPDDYHRWLGPAPFKIEAAPEEYFRTPLPDGEELTKAKANWKPDRSPVRSDNEAIANLEVTESGIEPRDNGEDQTRARALLL
jgi:hypothetical protein